MVELPKIFRNIFFISAAEISFHKQNLMALLWFDWIRHCKNRKMHPWAFRKHKHKYITDNDIDMKFGPDVINSAANSWTKN